MATSVTSASIPIPQRVAAATQNAAEYIHVDDPKRLTAAIIEITLEEMARNPGFALRIKGRYDELTPQKRQRQTAGGQKPKAASRPRKELVPVKRIEGREFNPAAPLDPYFLCELYGAEQLYEALDRHTLTNLKQAVAIVQERHPGTKPKGRLSKETAIAYIVEYVTGATS